MKQALLTLLALAGLVFLAACGGGKSSSSSSTTTTPVTVAVSPATATVTTGNTVQFAATVQNNSNTAVNWQVNGITGGNSAIGTISTSGLYTAPATVPNPAVVTVTAQSQADTTVSAAATVTVQSPLPTVYVAVNPSAIAVPAGGQQAFTATVSGQTATKVTWAVTCQATTSAACGSVSSLGVYTAPASPPPGGTVVVTAATTDNSALPGGAVVTVQFANGTLNGQYAFSFLGANSISGPFAVAGSITFDGQGNITGGVEDINTGSSSSTVTITGGSYHVGTDGRANATVQTVNGNVAWQIALVNHNHALAIRFDSATGSGAVNASGTLDLQDPSQFNLAAIKGNYALSLSGSGGTRLGNLAAAGALVTNGAGTITQGLMDVNSAGTASTNVSLSGTYTAPSSGGRGDLALTSSFGAQSFAYYVIDANHLVLLEKDFPRVATGDLVIQPTGPFTAANFKGGFAFALSGVNNQGRLSVGGVFNLDGAGGLGNGTADTNNNGNPQNGLTLTGTYSVADSATGRTTATLTVGGSSFQFVIYPQIGGVLNLVEVDAANTVGGAAYLQNGSPFTSASFQSNYALNLTGSDFSGNPGEQDISGQLVPNGGSAITGTLDINDNGVIAASTTLQLGSYQVTSGNGRGTATFKTGSGTLTSAAFNLYLIDSSTALLVESDTNRVLVGIVQKQY